jgi:hypothetical protein
MQDILRDMSTNKDRVFGHLLENIVWAGISAGDVLLWAAYLPTMPSSLPVISEPHIWTFTKSGHPPDRGEKTQP